MNVYNVSKFCFVKCKEYNVSESECFWKLPHISGEVSDTLKVT